MTRQTRQPIRRREATIRQVLLHDWDPIGVADCPSAHDEYDGYVRGIARLLEDGVDAFRLTDHLYHLETVCIGLVGQRDRCMATARKLLACLSTEDG